MAIILSGSGSDGAIGIGSIKESGGLSSSRSRRRELAEDYSCILNAICQYSDIDFTIYKTNTIYRRIERRIALNKFHGMEEYLDYLLSTEAERAQLYRDLLIGVTSFFRDGESFRHLGENVILPLLKKEKSMDSRLPERSANAGGPVPMIFPLSP